MYSAGLPQHVCVAVALQWCFVFNLMRPALSPSHYLPRLLAMPDSTSHARHAFTVRAFSALLLGGTLAACGGGESVAGPPPNPAAVRIESGASQEGAAGQPLPTRIAVTILDENGRPLPNTRVTFNVSPGGGSVNPTSVQTNPDGRAESRWTLGTQAGTAVATANVAGVAPATFTATIRPGPAAQVVASPNELSLGVGDTLRLQATARDQFGNTVEQLSLTWSSLDPAVVSLNGNLVTAVTQGTGRAVVTTIGPGGSLSDTVRLAVGPAGSSFCGTRQPTVPAIGEVVLLRNAARGAEQCIGASVAGASYALVLINTAANYGATKGLDVLALGVGTPPQANESSTFGLAATAPLAAAINTRSRDDGFEERLRLREKRELAPYVTAARERFAGGERDNQSRSGGMLAAQIQPPAVGSVITLNAQALSACSQPRPRGGRVVAVSQRAVIVADTSNPTGGYTDAEYEAIAATFDTLTWPLATRYFGEPTNVGQFNRITLFYTSAVNQLTPPSAGFVIGGFFFARDLYPKTARNNLPACAESNEREMMYLLVADPSGQINGNSRSKADVTRLNRTTVAHELQHLINSGRRLLVTPNANVNEETWLDEGLAHTAEELLYFRIGDFGSRGNLGLQQVAPNAARAQLFSNYAAQNFARWVGYLRAPESQSPYAPNDSLATRGAAWNFLRYAAGRQPTEEAEAAFYRTLVNSPQSGIANLRASLPSGELSAWLRDWAVAIFSDDLAANLDPIYTIPAWNFRSILPSLTLGGQPLGSYPLATRTLPPFVARRVTLAGGGSSYLRFSVPAASRALISVTLNGQAPDGDVQMAVVRYR